MFKACFCAVLCCSSLGFAEDSSPAPSPAKDVPASHADQEPEKFQSQLASKVSFELVDVTLKEFVRFIDSLARVTVFLDPVLSEESIPKIELKVSDMPLREAIDKALKQTGTGAKLHYTDGAYWISKTKPVRDLEAPPKPIPVLSEKQQQAVAEAIGQFSNNEFEVRNAAEQIVKNIGLGAIPQLEKACKQANDDLERHDRTLKLLGVLRNDQKMGVFAPATAKALQRKCSMEFESIPIEEATTFLTSQLMGCCNLEMDDELSRVAISFEVVDMDIACVMRWIARVANAQLKYGEKSIRLVKRTE